jgi:serine protease Do
VERLGAGSGWIIDSNGLVVTNHHVIAGVQHVAVTLHDGRIFSVSQMASDPASDLAVLKIDASGLPAARLGSSSALEQGMQVAVLGNALGRGIAMSGGWVSRLGTSLTQSTGDTLYDLIETDAAINLGNSGGPMANMAGEVVGVTNAKLVSKAVEGIGFAISIDWALPTIEQLIRQGKATRPWIGTTFVTVNTGIAEHFNLAVAQGALIIHVVPGSPAAAANLRQGNVIIGIDGKSILNATAAAMAIQRGVVGTPMEISYWEGHYHGTVKVSPIDQPPPS